MLLVLFTLLGASMVKEKETEKKNDADMKKNRVKEMRGKKKESEIDAWRKEEKKKKKGKKKEMKENLKGEKEKEKKG